MNEPYLPGDRPWIETRGLCFAHGRNRVLRHVSLEFRPGRHYIVAGPNGAGKSTLLDLLANLRRPDAGELTILDRDIREYEPGRLALALALAPQEFLLNFAFSIREVVAMGRRPHLGRWGRLGAEDLRVVEASLAALHLGPIAHKAVTALSGGERRRCVVARAIAQATPILLLDEPNAGLDVAQSLSLMTLARGLAESGRLVVTVSHDLNLAAAFGHEIVFVKNGEVAASGPMDRAFTSKIISEIYETDALVRRDDFSGGLSVSFRHRERLSGMPPLERETK